MLTVSLTSIPPRFAQLPRVVAALRAQADRVVVCLPRQYRRFPGRIKPPALPGADILWIDNDLGPACKVLPVARALRGQDTDLLYCDDDWDYAPGWADAFRVGRAHHPAAVLAGASFGAERLQLAGPPIAQGFAGVMIHPDWLDDIAMSPPDCAWAVDDIWLSGTFARTGRKIIELPEARALAQPLTDPGNLQRARIGGLTRAEANRACATDLGAQFDTFSDLK